jgi:hypothetical protein
MTNNAKTLQDAAWVTVGASMLHSTGATVENRKINADTRAWIITLPTGELFTNPNTKKALAYTTPEGAALVYEALIGVNK